MHKAVRNVTRLFERIQDFEKRVRRRVAESSTVQTRRPRSRPCSCWRESLAPFAPHAAEALLLAGGEDADELPGPWPERLALPAVSSGAGTP